MKLTRIIFQILSVIALTSCNGGVYRLSDFGIYPNTGEDMTLKIANVIETIQIEQRRACNSFV